MKNQYVADINDYKKYGLLRALSSPDRKMGVCWMLTADDGSTDGKHISYLDQPEKWCNYDPVLFECLKSCVENNDRNVKAVEKGGVLGPVKFFSDVLCDDSYERAKYFHRLRSDFESVDVVFFDPDNGLEIKSRPKGRKGSSRYIYWDELSEVYRFGKSVLVYQHFPMEKREIFISRIAAQLCQRLGVEQIFSFKGSHSVFFLAPQKHHDFSLQVERHKKAWGAVMAVEAHSGCGDPLRQAEKKICEIHKCDLLLGAADILYGHYHPPEGYFEIANVKFPNANSFSLGGCCIGPDVPKKKEVMFCPACRYHEGLYKSEG